VSQITPTVGPGDTYFARSRSLDGLPSSLRASGATRRRRWRREEAVHTPPRQRARIVPPSPITVAIDDENGLPLGYGVIANVSEAGACIWTDGSLEPGARLVIRISFARPSEVYEVSARVVWGDEGEDRTGAPMLRYGVQWGDASTGCVQRLRDMALRATSGERRTGSHVAVPPSLRADAN
jgi:hypothetical protein